MSLILATLGGPIGAQLARPVQALPEHEPPIKGTRDTVPKAPGWLDAKWEPYIQPPGGLWNGVSSTLDGRLDGQLMFREGLHQQG